MRRDVRSPMKSTLLLCTLLTGCAGTVQAPYPAIHADSSSAALERGAAIFHASCEACHRGGDMETASGAPLHELPSYMGSFHSSNLTSHPTAGIGSATDGELARAIRYAVSRDGRLMVMPSYGMGDKDVAAVLGFMRSNHPLFSPDPKLAPRSEFSFIGGLGFRFITGNEPVQRPPLGIPVPSKGPTLEYGRYMAHDVYDCASCHTPGFSPDKTSDDKVFSGGMAFKDAEGHEVLSSNITFHATGLAHWTLEDFTRAVRDGIAPDGSMVRMPMPRFRGMDNDEARALYDYLRSMPPRKNEVEGARPRLTATSQRPAWVAAAPGGEATRSTESVVVASGTPASSTSTVVIPASGTLPRATGAASPGTTAPSNVSASPRATASPGVPDALAATRPAASSSDADSVPHASPSSASPQALPAPASVDAAKLFTQFGCVGCHGPGARYHAQMTRAAGRTEDELVQWIRTPARFQPGTPMPTYAELLDIPTAQTLARWVKSGGPTAPASVTH
ncbi:c-type cytochrome [Myxococcus stipitatus]|uniref:c-type cytochrome n=1 Tax=Myxococcus stipitatus TaxID=83455 RepID=UPI0030CEF8DD